MYVNRVGSARSIGAAAAAASSGSQAKEDNEERERRLKKKGGKKVGVGVGGVDEACRAKKQSEIALLLPLSRPPLLLLSRLSSL